MDAHFTRHVLAHQGREFSNVGDVETLFGVGLVARRYVKKRVVAKGTRQAVVKTVTLTALGLIGALWRVVVHEVDWRSTQVCIRRWIGAASFGCLACDFHRVMEGRQVLTFHEVGETMSVHIPPRRVPEHFLGTLAHAGNTARVFPLSALDLQAKHGGGSEQSALQRNLPEIPRFKN